MNADFVIEDESGCDMKKYTRVGDFHTFGVVIDADGGATFTFEVQTKAQPQILLYDRMTKAPVDVIALSPEHSFGRVYSIYVKGLKWERLCYLLERDGETAVDPYAPLIVGREAWMNEERIDEGYAVYGGFPTGSFKWSGAHPAVAPEEMVIYKLHLRGFTMANGLSATKRGNYRGVIARLPYLKELGITTLEFLPLYDFEEIRYQYHYEINEDKKTVMVAEEPIGTNYWGYGKANYFAPKASYFGGKGADIHMKEMVDAIHRAGMEIVMEISFVSEMPRDEMVDNLIYWVQEYHIDGFHLLGMDLPIRRIAQNAYLGATKIFYDQFPAELLLKETEPKHLFVTGDDFLYPLRRLQNHFDGNVAELSNYMRRQGDGYGFVNYAASNTGFTLWDAYSYGEKHNEGNGEDNADGQNYNCSYNHGCEGESANRLINQVRISSMRTALACVFLSQGIPMIYAGDEAANSQAGNNNPYCQDNEIGWTAFSRRKLPKQLKEYVRHLIEFRKKHTVLSQPKPMQMTDYRHSGMPDLSYHGREPWIMGIGEEKKALGILLNGYYTATQDEEDVMICLNFYYGTETFALPRLPRDRRWFFVTNTGDAEWQPGEEPLNDQTSIIVPGETLSILVSKSNPTPAKRKRTLKRRTAKKSEK